MSGRSMHVSEASNGHDPNERSKTTPFGVVVAAGRPTVRAFFTEIGRIPGSRASIALLPLDAHAVGAAEDRLEQADVAVVDASVERAEAISVCAAIRKRQPELPISAVFC